MEAPAEPAPAGLDASSAMTEQAADEIRDVDRDSLHILPLSIVPIETPALKRALLIKNVRLQSIIEFFSYKETGSGQVEIEDLGGEFGWPEIPTHPDLILLRKLGDLPSYDVFSLRILLRDHGISVNGVEALKLSPAKQSELNEYMTSFSRPLIKEIYGGEDVSIQTFEDVIRLFRDPDLTKAREKLKIMAEKLEIGLEDVPKFLEDYGDIFLSLSYYRQ